MVAGGGAGGAQQREYGHAHLLSLEIVFYFKPSFSLITQHVLHTGYSFRNLMILFPL